MFSSLFSLTILELQIFKKSIKPFLKYWNLGLVNELKRMSERETYMEKKNFLKIPKMFPSSFLVF